MVIVLGIDPGLRTTGYGIISYSYKKLTYLGSGCIKTNIHNITKSLNIIYLELTKIINNYSPKFCVIERIFISKNVDSALKLGHARGAAIVAVSNFRIPIFEYTPSEVKKSIVGIGKAEKKQVQYMVNNLLNLDINLKYDASDALAIAITHCYKNIIHT